MVFYKTISYVGPEWNQKWGVSIITGNLQNCTICNPLQANFQILSWTYKPWADPLLAPVKECSNPQTQIPLPLRQMPLFLCSRTILTSMNHQLYHLFTLLSIKTQGIMCMSTHKGPKLLHLNRDVPTRLRLHGPMNWRTIPKSCPLQKEKTFACFLLPISSAAS